jgi:hypothetical protein
MAHYVINAVPNNRARREAVRAFDREVEELEEQCPLSCWTKNPDDAAVRLSALEGVDRVVVTHVHERTYGVWRGGVRS